MRLLQITIGLLIWLLFSRGSIWAAIPFQEYERYPILGTICAQLEKQVDQHAYKILHVDSEENSYYFDVEGTRLFIDNMVIYSRYPVNPVNDIDNLRKYLRFLSHSLYIGRNEKRNEFELIGHIQKPFMRIYIVLQMEMLKKKILPLTIASNIIQVVFLFISVI